MPSFDIVSKVDMQAMDNAVNITKKEITNRFDLTKIIENPNVQRKVNSTLSRGGRGNKTFMHKIIRILFGLLGLAGAFEQKPAVLNYHLYNSDLSGKKRERSENEGFSISLF